MIVTAEDLAEARRLAMVERQEICAEITTSNAPIRRRLKREDFADLYGGKPLPESAIWNEASRFGADRDMLDRLHAPRPTVPPYPPPAFCPSCRHALLSHSRRTGTCLVSECRSCRR